MMKKLLFAVIFAFAAIMPAFAENEDVITTFNEQYTYAHELKVKSRLHEVKLSSDLATFVTIEIVPLVDLETLCIWSSESTFVVANDGKVVLPLLGLHTPGEGEGFCRCNYEDKMGWKNAKSGQSYYYTLAFSGTVPPGITEMSLIDTAETGRGWCFYNRAINNPKKSEPLTEAMCKEWINQGNDGVTGIYEEVGGDKNKVACVKLENGNYLVFYLNSWNEKPWWFEGNFKGIMEPTATAGIYKGIWVKENKVFDNEVFFAFDGASMRLQASTDEPKERAFVKMYPAAAGGQAVMQNQGGNAVQAGGAAGALSQWSGTGFALYNNYIATNYHVVDGAQSILVRGVHGDFTKDYKAVVVATDKYNDLAILKVEGVTISNSNIPYAVRTATADVAEEVFVLGYPMTAVLGEQIKFTDGKINSKTGYMGDVSLYQISASLHGGNSGGPVFDENGNVIAVAVAHLDRATTENVNYAIKASYLRNLMESVISEDILPKANTISQLKRSEMVKKIQNFVYYIECAGVKSEQQ